MFFSTYVNVQKKLAADGASVFIKQPAQPHIFSEDTRIFDRNCGLPYKWHIGLECLRYEATSLL